MYKSVVMFFAAVLAVSVLTVPVQAGEKPGAAEMRINIGLASSNPALRAKVINILAKYGGRLEKEIPQLQALTYVIPNNKFLSIKSRLLIKQPLVQYLEEDYRRKIALKEIRVLDDSEVAGFQTAYVPGDPQYPSQWGPPCIGAEAAWDVELGDKNVIVAVVDTGVDWNHPDLAANVDTSIDFDFVNNDNDAMDDNGHGTHVSGTIAAEINNLIGVAGLQQVTIMAVKGLDAAGSGRDSVLAQCIVYAVDNGARVINCSWGGLFAGAVIRDAVNYAFDQGAVVVAAAGNLGVNWKFYPASYSKVVGVAALQDCTSRASWSNWGYSNVQIAAPGADIISTYWDDAYAVASGTSMASPHVAGVVAAYFSYDPSFTNIDVLTHMAANADDLGTPGNDKYYGYGRVDMFPFAD